MSHLKVNNYQAISNDFISAAKALSHLHFFVAARLANRDESASVSSVVRHFPVESGFTRGGDGGTPVW